MEDIYKYKYIKFKTKYLKKKGGGYKNCKDCNKKEDANKICENIDSQGRRSLHRCERRLEYGYHPNIEGDVDEPIDQETFACYVGEKDDWKCNPVSPNKSPEAKDALDRIYQNDPSLWYEDEKDCELWCSKQSTDTHGNQKSSYDLFIKNLETGLLLHPIDLEKYLNSNKDAYKIIYKEISTIIDLDKSIPKYKKIEYINPICKFNDDEECNEIINKLIYLSLLKKI